MEGDQKDFNYGSSVGFAADDSRELLAKYTSDPLFLQSLDHPGMTLVTFVLRGNNSLS